MLFMMMSVCIVWLWWRLSKEWLRLYWICMERGRRWRCIKVSVVWLNVTIRTNWRSWRSWRSWRQCWSYVWPQRSMWPFCWRFYWYWSYWFVGLLITSGFIVNVCCCRLVWCWCRFICSWLWDYFRWLQAICSWRSIALTSDSFQLKKKIENNIVFEWINLRCIK